MTSITTLEIDPTDYAGGIAVWAAMAPVFDTTGSPPESGIHVHAREYPGKRKAIDQTFDQVRVKTRHAGQSEYVEIDGPLARLFNVADILVEPPQAIRCPNCSTLVNDTGWAAVLPRQMRKCAVCECIFESSKPIIANAIAELRQMLNVGHDMKQPVKSTKRWHHSLVDWPSGVQVWGSNAAILWTAERSEEAGVHVHAYNNTIIGKPRLADETFGDVAIDGSQLDEKQIRFLMAQLASPVIAPYIASLVCPACNEQHFAADNPTTPTNMHDCEHCGFCFTTRKAVIANPAHAQLKSLTELWNRKK